MVINKRNLNYIHIGKCGGTTVKDALKNSSFVASRFDSIRVIHCKKPPIEPNSQYLIVLRNPISRAISAFNWRYYLVVETESQKNRFNGEWAVLQKYQSMENLANSLIKETTIDLSVVSEWNKIHHLREGIHFYLDELLTSIKRDQIFQVIIQENLNSDVEKYLRTEVLKSYNVHGYNNQGDRLRISDTGYQNLKAFLGPEYDCIKRLHDMHPIS